MVISEIISVNIKFFVVVLYLSFEIAVAVGGTSDIEYR